MRTKERNVRDKMENLSIPTRYRGVQLDQFGRLSVTDAFDRYRFSKVAPRKHHELVYFCGWLVELIDSSNVTIKFDDLSTFNLIEINFFGLSQEDNLNLINGRNLVDILFDKNNVNCYTKIFKIFYYTLLLEKNLYAFVTDKDNLFMIGLVDGCLYIQSSFKYIIDELEKNFKSGQTRFPAWMLKFNLLEIQ
jgi:hypothetical protein